MSYMHMCMCMHTHKYMPMYVYISYLLKCTMTQSKLTPKNTCLLRENIFIQI